MSRSIRFLVLPQLPWAGFMLALVMVWACMALPARAADMLVAPDGTGPYATIQDAIDAAGSGDSVVLMAGSYSGQGNRNLESDGSITIRRQNPGDEVTIDILGTVFNPAFGMVIYDGTLTLEGVTIRYSYHADYSAIELRGGIFIANDCRFAFNTSDHGGAISCNGGDRIVLTDCVLDRNTASVEGGAIYSTSFGEVVLTNCTLFMNDCNSGSAVYRGQGDTLVMDACMAVYGRGSYAFADYYGGAVTVTNTNIWGNEGPEWTGLPGVDAGTDGNLSVEPQMCDPMATVYALAAGSPCAVNGVVMGGAGQDLLWDVPVYRLMSIGSGMFPTIQAALDDVPGRASIVLLAGTYSGLGNVELDFQGKEIELSGAPSSSVAIDATTWDGQPKRAIWLRGGEPVGTTIRDLIIRNGITFSRGAGVFVSGGSSVTLRNIDFQNNLSNSAGGAVAATDNAGGDVVIDACTFDGNGAEYDVFASSGTLWLGNVDFGAGSVGSVKLESGVAGATFSNVSVEGCEGVSAFTGFTQLRFDNCTLVNSGNNGHTTIMSSWDVLFTNCTMRSDGASDTAIIFASSSQVLFEDCAFEGLGGAEINVVAVTSDFSRMGFLRTTFTNLRSDGVRGTIDLTGESFVSLDSCTFQQTATGVVGTGSGGVSLIISDCNFIAVDTPVKVVGEVLDQVTITNTEFTACGQGVEVTDYPSVTITGCGFRGTGPGVPFVTTNSIVSVTDCEFHDANVTYLAGRPNAGGIGCAGGEVTVAGSEFLRNDCEVGPGGITMRDGSLVITDCLFTDNNNLDVFGSLPQGGALFCSNSPLFSMTGSRLERNTASEGGAAWITAESMTLENCEIVDNRGTYFLGGLLLQPYATTGSLNMTGCLVAGNTAPSGVGNEFRNSPGGWINGCTFVGNGGSPGAAQLWLNGSGTMNLQSSIMAYGDGGEGLEVEEPQYLTLTVTCTDIYGNPGGDWVGNLVPFAGLGGNIEADPWFCDADLGDYHLAADSPCVDTENICGVTIGAYPAGCGAVTGVPDVPVIQRVALNQNHPNPFNPSTRIRFELPRETDVTLRVYDLAGKLVRELLAGERMPSGVHEVTWNGRDNAGREQATGFYLYRMEAGGTVLGKKMALVR